MGVTKVSKGGNHASVKCAKKSDEAVQNLVFWTTICKKKMFFFFGFYAFPPILWHFCHIFVCWNKIKFKWIPHVLATFLAKILKKSFAPAAFNTCVCALCFCFLQNVTSNSPINRHRPRTIQWLTLQLPWRSATPSLAAAGQRFWPIFILETLPCSVRSGRH